MKKNIVIEIVEVPTGFTKPKFEFETNIYSCMPPDIAMEMFDEMCRMEELLARGERCDKCGEMHFPEDLTQGLCEDCLMDLAIKAIEEEEEAEIKRLEELAELYAIISLMSDEYPEF